jgi:hypothetical protein
MPKKKEEPRVSRPASTPEAREQQLVNLAVELAERQLRDGTASPSVINHYLKIGSTREAIERQMLEKQAKLIEAKAQSIGESKDAEKLAKAAIEAMKNYNGGK